MTKTQFSGLSGGRQPSGDKGVKLKNVTDKIEREDLLDDTDLERMLRVCGASQRDRAFIHVLYEGGTRPGEILNLRIKHVRFDQYGANIKVSGKTGTRKVRLVTSAPDLASWINNHPDKENPQAPLWPNYGNLTRSYLTYAAANKLVKNVCHRAGIQKRVNPKLFRHSEATRTATFMTEEQLRKRHGWASISRMPAKYVHMNNQDVDEAVLKHHGITPSDKQAKKKTSRICAVCTTPNAYDAKLCSKCGKPLDVNSAVEMDNEKESQIQEMRKDLAEVRKENQVILKYFADYMKNTN